MADYTYVYSTIINFDNLYSAGIMSRYYIPFQINKYMINKAKLYIECNYNFTNYVIKTRFDYPEVYDKMNKIRINYLAGLNINLIKELYFDIAVEYISCPEGISFWGYRLGLEYHFNKKNKI